MPVPAQLKLLLQGRTQHRCRFAADGFSLKELRWFGIVLAEVSIRHPLGWAVAVGPECFLSSHIHTSCRRSDAFCPETVASFTNFKSPLFLL